MWIPYYAKNNRRIKIMTAKNAKTTHIKTILVPSSFIKVWRIDYPLVGSDAKATRTTKDNQTNIKTTMTPIKHL